MGSLLNRNRFLLLVAMLVAAAAGLQVCEAVGFNRPTDESTAATDSSPEDAVEDPAIESKEEKQARLTNDRFLALLKRRPGTGTALDRVYAFYLDRGTLDQFLSELHSLMKADDEAGVACLLVGLIETKQGNHLEAEQAFQLAEQRRPQDATASWLLGQSLLELQQAEAASMALERAIERSPQKSDLLLVFQDLGRAYRRSRQTEKANAVWQRMESQFPDDLRVKEQIATTLFKEGDLDAAVIRFAELSQLHRDPYHKTQYAIMAADLKLQLGRRDEALSDLEEQLQTLDPDSWLAGDIRRRIEQFFLRNNDQAGLVSYYETWLQNHPDDVEVMASLGHALALQGRGQDAQNWYRKALQKAPSSTPLRKALLEQLVRGKLFDEATSQYHELHEIEPGNIDHLQEWGLLVLHRDDIPLAERRARATAVWKRMLPIRPDDPGILVQVAELIRRAELPEEALPLYRRAIELAPQDAQYREYLGDYLLTLGRKDEAVQIWKTMAEGERRNTANLNRLAEIFRAGGMQEQALSAIQAACELTPEFTDQLKFARWLREYEIEGGHPKAEASLKQLDIAESLAETDEEWRLVLQERILSLIAAKQLDHAIDVLKFQLQKPEEAGKSADDADELQKIAAKWIKLAVYFEAANKLSDAMDAAKQSLDLAPDSVASWKLAARLYEQSGRHAEAVDAYQNLMSLDLRTRTESLQRIASLEQRLGRSIEALKAGKELVAAGPDNPAFLRFYADLCFHFGERQEALNTLRRSVRSSSADGGLILALARTLANQNEIEEATTLSWKAFEKFANLDDKLNAVMLLAELALRANRFDQLIDKLEQHGRVPDQEQESAQGLATAFRVAGDLRSARRALETSLTADRIDTKLLLHLSRLAEEDGDVEAAADYQRRTNSFAPSNEGQSRLANLLMRLGEVSEAETMWNRIAGDAVPPAAAIEAIDQLIDLESIDSAREICDRMLGQTPENWEVLIRRGILEWRYGQRETADQLFQRVLDLKLDSNTPSAAQSETLTRNDWSTDPERERLPTLVRLESVSELAEVFSERKSSSWFGVQPPLFMPKNYGAARIVAVLGRSLAARKSNSTFEMPHQLAASVADGALQAACDLQALEMFLSGRSEDRLFVDTDYQRFIPSARSGNIEAQAMFLELFALRLQVREVQDSVELTIENEDSLFVSDDQFSLVMTSFESVLNRRPEWLETFDAARLFAICRHQQQLKVLDALIARLMQKTESAEQLQIGLDLSLLRQNLSVEDALETLSLIASAVRINNPTPTNSTMVQGMADFEWYADRLLKIARMPKAAADIRIRLKPLDWWLSYHREVRQRASLKFDSQYAREAAQAATESVIVASDKDEPGRHLTGRGNPFELANALGVKNQFTAEECEFLTQIYTLVVQENAEATLNEWYRTQLDASSSEDATIEIELIRAVFANATDNHEQVLLHLIRAASKSSGDILLKLNVISRLESLQMKAEALELIGQLPDNDSVILKFREIKTLELAKALRLTEQAKIAATRLAGLELADEEQAYVVRELTRMGLEVLREQVEARRTKANVETPDASPLALLDYYEQQGNLSAAVQVAQQLLRRSHKNTTPWRNTTRATPEQIRARAYKVLTETGELEKMIERQKAQLAKSPHSGRLQKTLLDYLEAAGRIAEADELRLSLQRNQSGLSAKVMVDQAEELIRAKQPEIAWKKLLEVMHEHPAEFWDEASAEQVFGVFVETNRLTELANAVLLADRGRSHSYAPTETLEELIRLLLQDTKTYAKAAELIQRYSEMYPAYTVNFLMLVEQLPLWSSPDLFALLTRMYVPSTVEQLQLPQLAWPLDYEFRTVRLGFDQSAMDEGGNLKRLWDALKFSDERRLELERSANDAMTRLPEWPAGNVILIVCALSVPEKALDQDRIEKLVTELCEESRPAIPEAVAYNLTQLLRHRGIRMKASAVKLLETSLRKVQAGKLDFGQRASRALLELYAELNEPTKGQEFLRRSMLESSPTDPAHKELQREENSSDANVVPRALSRPLGGIPLAEQVKAELRKSLLKPTP